MKVLPYRLKVAKFLALDFRQVSQKLNASIKVKSLASSTRHAGMIDCGSQAQRLAAQRGKPNMTQHNFRQVIIFFLKALKLAAFDIFFPHKNFT